MKLIDENQSEIYDQIDLNNDYHSVFKPNRTCK